jgi:hypothetical protein
MRMLTTPDRDAVLARLNKMASSLGIDLMAIPVFIEEYGDIFLSLAYFRSCLDTVVPTVQRFIAWAAEIKKSFEGANDPELRRLVDHIASDLTDITTSLTGRFESFDRRSKTFWDNMSAESFQTVRELISAHHVTIGGVLCGLAVKMDLWKKRFPSEGGSPGKRIEFVKSEIRPGLAHIKSIEASAGSA